MKLQMDKISAAFDQDVVIVMERQSDGAVLAIEWLRVKAPAVGEMIAHAINHTAAQARGYGQ